MDNKNKTNVKYLLLLHLLLMLYSFCSVCGKSAAGYPFLSMGFIAYYGAEILLLFIYAIGWQQILKRMSLTFAFANKGITVVWSLVWGTVIFGEAVTIKKIIGCFLVICGVILYSTAEKEKET